MSDDMSARMIKWFDGTNFQGWKLQITAVLMANEIYKVVDRSRMKPADQEGYNAALTQAWVRDNAKATVIIAPAMKYKQLQSVLVCTTAKAMWDKLSTMHELKSVSTVCRSHKVFMRTKCRRPIQ